MDNIFLVLGGAAGAIGVALGAFGAHAIKRRVSAERLDTFETGVRYQMYHALALAATALFIRQSPAASLLPLAGWLYLAGIILFSGSLYLLVLTRKPWWGAITPLGGLAFIAGWACLGLSALTGR